MKIALLICALALPVIDKNKSYMLLKQFIEERYPSYTIVFINRDEKLLNPGAKQTPYWIYPEGLAIWAIRKSA